MLAGGGEMAKRYLLLCGADYYPAGWDDFRGDFATVDEAVAAARTHMEGEGYRSHWYEVIDLNTLKVAAKGRD
jgi:hypothetical protein